MMLDKRLLLRQAYMPANDRKSAKPKVQLPHNLRPIACEHRLFPGEGRGQDGQHFRGSATLFAKAVGLLYQNAMIPTHLRLP